MSPANVPPSSKAGRRKSRQRAVQVLYQIDMRGLTPEEAIAAYFETLADSEEGDREAGDDPFLVELVNGTRSRLDVLDVKIQDHAQHWKVERMSAVDRNVLRLGVYEMLYTETPPAVAIDEALEVARRFSGDESVGFINGILDSVRRDNLPDIKT